MDWKESDTRKSPKVREIIDRMPPVLAHYGVAVVLASLLMTFFVFALMPYHPKVSVTTKQTINADSTICVHAIVPYELFNNFPSAFSNIRINKGKTEYQFIKATKIGNEENDQLQVLIEWNGQYSSCTQTDSTTMILRLGKVPLLFWMMGWGGDMNKQYKTRNALKKQ